MSGAGKLSNFKNIENADNAYKQLCRICEKNLQEQLRNYLKNNYEVQSYKSYWSSIKRYFRQIEDGQTTINKGMRRELIKVIERFFYQQEDDELVYETLLHRLGGVTYQSSNQSALENYTGIYDAYYTTSNDDSFDESILEIVKVKGDNRNYFRWLNKSINSDFVSHHGYAFDYKNRIYLTGMGYNFTRPMLIRKPKQFRKPSVTLSAVVMAHTLDDNIFAASCILVHENNTKRNYYRENSRAIAKLMAEANMRSHLIKLNPPDS